jgi:hypothetical protein
VQGFRLRYEGKVDFIRIVSTETELVKKDLEEENVEETGLGFFIYANAYQSQSD